METPKIALSDAEQLLLADASVILTKNSVIEKISQLFGELGNLFYAHCQPFNKEFPKIFQPHPKLSKGEKHEQLPWVMLDYPRVFGKDGQLAIRCFCWWGHYFSIQLQVSGQYKNGFLYALPAWLSNHPNNWYHGTTADPWNMLLPPAWTDIGAPRTGEDGTFLKLAKKIPISEWESFPENIRKYFFELMELVEAGLKHQYGAAIL